MPGMQLLILDMHITLSLIITAHIERISIVFTAYGFFFSQERGMNKCSSSFCVRDCHKWCTLELGRAVPPGMKSVQRPSCRQIEKGWILPIDYAYYSYVLHHRRTKLLSLTFWHFLRLIVVS
jgi:hypothetical protein